MPLFEYACRDCGRRFEQVVFGQARPVCPSCESRSVSKLLSVFAVGSAEPSGGREAGAPGGCGSCGDPRGPGACSMN
jgi:putative FmdB family regulatory protein